MLRTSISTVFLSMVLLLAAAGGAWAHVGISPDEVEPGATESFTVSVPTEKDVPTIGISLEVPPGVEVTEVSSPSGWQGVVEGGSIVWSGGEIGVGESQEFAFEATVPRRAGAYAWPAAQTYRDGSVVEWDGTPDSEEPAPMVEVTSGGPAGAGEDRGHDGSHESGEDHGSEPQEMPETGGIAPALLYGLGGLALATAGGALMRVGRRR